MLNRVRFRVEDIKDSRVIFFLLGAGIATSVTSLVFHEGLDFNWWDGFWQNFSTEVFGALMTFILIETIVRERRQKEDDERARETYKKQLLREMRSRSNDTAVSAVEALREEGWLQDGTLNEQNMKNANLYKADLQNANLQEATLTFGNLCRATLAKSNLQRTNFWQANLEQAVLKDTHLQGADLWGANLRGAFLANAEFDEQTVLPDGSKWSNNNSNLKRFTDPNHPKFWEPDWVVSRAKDDDLTLHHMDDLWAILLQELKLLRAAQKVNGRVLVRGRR